MSKALPVKPVTLKLDPKILREMKKRADALGMKLSPYYQMAISHWLEKAA